MVLDESTGSFFRHMRVRKFSRGQYSRKPTEERLSFLPRITCFLNRNGFLVLIKFCTNVKGKQALKTFHLCASEWSKWSFLSRRLCICCYPLLNTTFVFLYPCRGLFCIFGVLYHIVFSSTLFRMATTNMFPNWINNLQRKDARVQNSGLQH